MPNSTDNVFVIAYSGNSENLTTALTMLFGVPVAIAEYTIKDVRERSSISYTEATYRMEEDYTPSEYDIRRTIEFVKGLPKSRDAEDFVYKPADLDLLFDELQEISQGDVIYLRNKTKDRYTSVSEDDHGGCSIAPVLDPENVDRYDNLVVADQQKAVFLFAKNHRRCTIELW